MSEKNFTREEYVYLAKLYEKAEKYNDMFKYVNKFVKLRSPMCCLGEHVCSVCVGRFPYITGIRNIGVTFADIPNAAVNGGMKKFHKSAIKMDDVDIDTLII